MDPVTVLLAPWAQLGVIGAVVVGLALIGWKLWSALEASRAEHIGDVKAFAKEYSDAMLENAKSNATLAQAIDRIGERIK